MSGREFTSQFIEYIRYKFGMTVKDAREVKKQKRINSTDRAVVFSGFNVTDKEALDQYTDIGNKVII